MQSKQASYSLSDKQSLAHWYLTKKRVPEVCYGGAAGGGKSYFAAGWQIERRLSYAGTNGFFAGRDKVKLKKTILRTFTKAADAMGLTNGYHYTATMSTDVITFANGSLIDFIDLKAKPSDPDYEYLGGYEWTDGVFEEMAQLPERGVSIARSRIRWRNDEYGLPRSSLATINPTKGWAYRTWYKPWKAGTLDKNKAFVQAFVHDNPDATFAKNYAESLEQMDYADRLRLLEGKWEFDDDIYALCKHDSIEMLFDNWFLPGGEKWVTVDVALHGSDSMVLGVWDGWKLTRVVQCPDLSPKVAEALIRKVCAEENLETNRVIVDSSGVGAWLPDYLQGAVPFVAGSSPVEVRTPRNGIKQQYQNLRSQCGFLLAEKINDCEVYVSDNFQQFHPKDGTFSPARACRDMMVQDLEQLRRAETEDFTKLALAKKSVMKAQLGRSPDFQDMLMMRVLPELRGSVLARVVA